jgi:hypothetical protein
MVGKRLVLCGACVISALVGNNDVAVATMTRPGGAQLTAKMIEQIDCRTFRLEVGGAQKEGALRGVITVRADRISRFRISAGALEGPTLYGSLGNLRIGPTVPISVTLGPLLPDGSYRLIELMTVTR